MTPRNQAPGASFWDRSARRYAASPVSDMLAYEETLARTRAHLTPGDRVLELGCGTGTTALLLAPSVAAYTATDQSPAMIAIAREKAAGSDTTNLTLRAEAVASIRTPPDGPFDAVLAFNLIHLLPDPVAGLAGIRGLLRPGGVFVSKTTCIGGGLRGVMFTAMIAALRAVGKAPPVQSLTVGQLDAMIADAGFEILDTGVMPASPPARFVVARRSDR